MLHVDSLFQAVSGEWVVIGLLCVAGLAMASPASADCVSLIGDSTRDLNWGEDDQEWVQIVAGTPSVPLTLGSGLAVGVPYMMTGGLQVNHPLEPVLGLAMLPGCVTYETISSPLQVLDTVISGASGSDTNSKARLEQSMDPIDRTQIAAPNPRSVSSENQHKAGGDDRGH